VFFDTNVLIYALDRSDPSKHARADALLAKHMAAHSMVVSTQVLQEMYVALVSKRHLAPADALLAVRAVATVTVMPSSGDFVLRALELAQQFRLSAWDALIVQAASEARCRVLLSEDLQAGMRFGEMEVVNPFEPGVREPVRLRGTGRRSPER